MAKPSDSSTRSASPAASANRLGTLALVLADRTADAVAEATGHADSTAAALSALHHFLDAPSIELLRQVLGLTHSGTVRLVDGLERGECPLGEGKHFNVAESVRELEARIAVDQPTRRNP